MFQDFLGHVKEATRLEPLLIWKLTWNSEGRKKVLKQLQRNGIDTIDGILSNIQQREHSS